MITWKHKILLKFRFWLINDKLSSTRKSFRVFDDAFPKRFQVEIFNQRNWVSNWEKLTIFKIPNSENEFTKGVISIREPLRNTNVTFTYVFTYVYDHNLAGITPACLILERFL